MSSKPGQDDQDEIDMMSDSNGPSKSEQKLKELKRKKK